MQNKVFTIKRSITALAAFLLIMLLTVTGCSNPGLTPGEVPGTNDTGTVRFSWSDGEQASRSRANNILDADKVVITIEAADGTVVYNQKQLKLYNFNGSFISEPLSLKVGSYRLTEYLILDSAGTVIFATPKAGSAQAHLVTMPLPQDFTVTKDGTTKVKPQVVDATAVNPADFGYIGFNFEEAKLFNFLVSVMIFDASADGFILTDATLDVTTDAKAYNFALTNTTNSLAINDVAGNYTLTLKKAGYEEYKATFTNAEMKGFFQTPLVITPVPRQVVTFPDPKFTEGIRARLNKPTGDIYLDEVNAMPQYYMEFYEIFDITGAEHLISAELFSVQFAKVTDISPLANLTRLQRLHLTDNTISNLTPLTSLTQLKSLWLDRNHISDVSSLTTLTELTDLILDNNSLTDISPLAPITKLTRILLRQNQITDITALSGMTNLGDIRLNDNNITDIAPLAGLTKVTYLTLDNNKITDLTPLVNNAGLGSGTSIYLKGNPLSPHAINVQIPALQARGIHVSF